MVPSMKNQTGWKYIPNAQLDAIAEANHKKVPGQIQMYRHNKLKPLSMSKDDPNHMFPDVSTSAIMNENGELKDKITGLKANFKVTQAGGATRQHPSLRMKSYITQRMDRRGNGDKDRQSNISMNDMRIKMREA